MARVLVTYGSKYGATAEISEAIAEQLGEHGHEVACLPVEEAPNPEQYDAAVIGSGVYAGRWTREARRYLKRNLDALAKRPFWIFSSGPVGDRSEMTEEQIAEDLKWTEPRKVRELAESAGVHGRTVFGGRVPPEASGFIAKSMAKKVPPEFHDLRDWDEIRGWASEISAQLESSGR